MSESLRVLSVEDDLLLGRLLAGVLTPARGFEARVVASGQAAEHAVDGFTPDLLLLDVQLPDMTGLELLNRLRRRPELREADVVFLTAATDAASVAAYDALGAQVIAKPFDPFQLAAQLRSLAHKDRQ